MRYNFQKAVSCFKGYTRPFILMISLLLSGCPGPDRLQVVSSSTNTNQPVHNPVDQVVVIQAIKKDDVEAFNQLLAHGLDVYERLNGKTMLYMAAKKGSKKNSGQLVGERS